MAASQPPPPKYPIPFLPTEELTSDLYLITTTTTTTSSSKQTLPQLQRGAHPNINKTPQTLPGNASVDLSPASIQSQLQTTVLTTKLNTMAPHLWLISTQSSASISPLHKQRILGREILISDTADLHLIWHYSRIFLKPLPRYLLSHAFWEYLHHLSSSGKLHDHDQEDILPAITGFLRTYAHLIQSETDFRIALSHGLVPEDIRFEPFAKFIKRFKNLPNSQASPRFSFGELRLTRLNFWAVVFLRQRHYFNVSRQYETYFERFFGPLLFIFGTLSVLLSAMQVGLAAVAMESVDEWAWERFVSVSKWTSVAAIFVVLAAVVWLSVVLVTKILGEFVYALGMLWKKRASARTNAV
ncbi:hypothetical protein B0H63DRAFT_14818 [Podospora didyma]|uniref:Subtilisin-like serine protease protein n=1 Tax=Podospora didyma TaxID=330526 RepID=A0AAE0P4S4_9PEZI|nr:hypothetical protein B0H63DRAFT_14818 [Podospora didyma]